MTRKYKQLSLEERLAISNYLDEGLSKSRIAKLLFRARSTITREINRNLEGGRYNPVMAYINANHRRYRQHYRRLELEGSAIQKYIISKLKVGWSPEQIAGRLKKNGIIIAVSRNM